MARCDYHGCAVCDGKAFYNANMSLDDEGGYWGNEVVALCEECAKTHQIVVQPKAQSNPVESNGWVDCKQELPPTDKNHCWLAWITSQNKAGGYTDLVSYGNYVCQNEDIRPGDEGYTEDDDDGNFKQFGWYREEETHGGEYDYIFVNLNGKVTHWQPLPAPPISNTEDNNVKP